MPKIEDKNYKCKECGYRKRIATNHFGECYSLGNYNACPNCEPYKRPTVWILADPIPKDGWVPKPWELIKIGDLCTLEGDKDD